MAERRTKVPRERWDELLADEALGGLSRADAVELGALVAHGRDTTLALTAALGAQALSAGPEAMPASVCGRLLAAADAFEESHTARRTPRPAGPRPPALREASTTTAGAQVILVPAKPSPAR